MRSPRRLPRGDPASHRGPRPPGPAHTDRRAAVVESGRGRGPGLLADRAAAGRDGPGRQAAAARRPGLRVPGGPVPDRHRQPARHRPLPRCRRGARRWRWDWCCGRPRLPRSCCEPGRRPGPAARQAVPRWRPDGPDADLLDAVARMLRLLDSPADAAVLAPLIEQEILWRLLTGPHGDMVRQIGLADSDLSQLNTGDRLDAGQLRRAGADRGPRPDVRDEHVGVSSALPRRHGDEPACSSRSASACSKRARCWSLTRAISQESDIGSATTARRSSPASTAACSVRPARGAARSDAVAGPRHFP